MSKSILVIDAADRCWGCELKKSCKVIPKNQSGSKWNVIHPQCPLQDTTELLEALERIALNKNVKIMTYEKYDIDKPRESIYFSDSATTVILDEDYNTIKQALIDKDNRIKELEEEAKCNLDLSNDWSDKATKLQSKLDKIEEEVNIFNKLDVEYEMNDIDNILKFVNILLWILKESE